MSRPVPQISFEFFPPKTLDASFRLWETARALAPGERCIVEAVDGLTLIVRAARPGITASPRPGAVHGKAAAPDSITGEHG